MSKIAERLAARALTLPEAATPVANYAPWVAAGDLIYVSGQLSRDEGGALIAGKLGADLTLAQGAAAAASCALAILAQLHQAAGGDWARLERGRLLKLTGFVNSTGEFTEQPKVIDGASDLFAALLGDEAGRHARSAVSAASLPFGAAVEIEAIFQLG